MKSALAPAVLVLLGLAGCTTVPRPGPSLPEWNNVKAARQGLAHWDLSGRAAVATPEDGWNATINWAQSESRSELKLQGALGIGGLRVKSDGEFLDIETSKGEKLSGEAARQLLEQTLGVALPLQALRFWLLGVPQPEIPALAQLNPEGRLAQLNQGGWALFYDRYQLQQGAWLPGRIRLEKDQVKVRVVVDRWAL